MEAGSFTLKDISFNRFKLTGDLNIDERISNLKKEIGELEKKASQKLTQIKSLQTFENAKTEAKKLGDRVYEAAKNLLWLISSILSIICSLVSAEILLSLAKYES